MLVFTMMPLISNVNLCTLEKISSVKRSAPRVAKNKNQFSHTEIEKKRVRNAPQTQCDWDPLRLLGWKTVKKYAGRNADLHHDADINNVHLCAMLSADRTFRVMSRLWRQWFILIGFFADEWVPMAFGYLPSKLIESYKALFSLVKIIAAASSILDRGTGIECPAIFNTVYTKPYDLR